MPIISSSFVYQISCRQRSFFEKMPATKERNVKYPTYIILGSGGHTAEMCKINEALLKSLRGIELYQPLRYVVAKTDSTSRTRMVDTMTLISVPLEANDFIEVPRSREVGQSWLTTVFTAFWALLWSFWLIWRDKPRLVLCNGPGTCVPYCVAMYCWRFLGRLQPHTKIVFIESFCRVKTLSLSGRILLPFVDMFVVQWPTLADRYKRYSNVKYFGRLM